MPPPDDAVTQFLAAAPTIAMPAAVAARLQQALTAEANARRSPESTPAEGVKPTPTADPLKSSSPYWSAGQPARDH